MFPVAAIISTHGTINKIPLVLKDATPSSFSGNKQQRNPFLNEKQNKKGWPSAQPVMQLRRKVLVHRERKLRIAPNKLVAFLLTSLDCFQNEQEKK